MRKQSILLFTLLLLSIHSFSQTPSLTIADIDINLQPEYDNWVLNNDTFFVIPISLDTFVNGVDSFCFNLVYDPTIMKPLLNISEVNDPAYLLILNYVITVPFAMIEDLPITIDTFSVPNGTEMLSISYSNPYAFNQGHYGNCQGNLMYIPFKKLSPCSSGSFPISFWDGFYNGTYTNPLQQNSCILGGNLTYSVANNTLNINNGSLNVSELEVTVFQYGNNLESNVINGQLPFSYFWSSGETSPFISPSHNGNYSVIVTDANTCIDTSNTFLFSFTGIDMVSTEVDFTVFPNPAKDYLIVETNQDQNLEVEIFNAFGALIFRSNINNSMRINVRDWDKGLYYLRLDEVRTRKIIVI